MADNVTLQANEREGRGKNAARRLRASGMTPAVLYGDAESTALAVETRTLDYTLTHFGDNALYDIDLGSGSSTARVVDAHRDPVTGLLVHVDFAPVNMRERIEVTVPLTVVGEAAGSEEGGVLQQVAYEIQVETLPGDIPQEITLDVTPLGMNENLTLGDLSLLGRNLLGPLLSFDLPSLLVGGLLDDTGGLHLLVGDLRRRRNCHGDLLGVGDKGNALGQRDVA